MTKSVKACVIGWPIEHSRSPIIHNYWLKQHGIDGVYEKRPVAPKDLRTFLENLSELGYRGCNITIPHKTAAFEVPHIEDEATKNIGALNTVYYQNGRLMGLNTDGMGFCASVAASIDGWTADGLTCLIIGAGGAARSIAFSLKQQGARKLIIYNRTQERAADLCTALGSPAEPVTNAGLESALKETDLLINTTSLGMVGQAPLEISLDSLPDTAIVCDIVYAPLETNLLISAQERGLRTVGGLGMLLHQAVPGFEKWFGVRPTVTKELYDLVVEDLVTGNKQ